MALAELTRLHRNEAHMLIGRLAAEGIAALALDGNANIADGSAFFIPVRVMVDADDLAAANAVIDALPNR